MIAVNRFHCCLSPPLHLLLNLFAMHGKAPSTITKCLITSAQYQTKQTPPSLLVKQLEMNLMKVKIRIWLQCLFISLTILLPFSRNISFYDSITALCLTRPRQRGYVLTSRLPYLNAPPLFPLTLPISTWWTTIAGPACNSPYSSPTCQYFPFLHWFRPDSADSGWNPGIPEDSSRNQQESN